jgi:hypothetical protein
VRSQGAPVIMAVRPPSSGMAVANLGAQPLELRGRRYASGWDGPARVEVAPKATLSVRLAPDRGTQPWQLRVTGEAARLCSLAEAP